MRADASGDSDAALRCTRGGAAAAWLASGTAGGCAGAAVLRS